MGYDNEKMHLAIMHLAQIMPNLRELDHSGFDERRQAWKRIILRREITVQRVTKQSTAPAEEGEEGKQSDVNEQSMEDYDEMEIEHVTYAVGKARPRFVAIDYWRSTNLTIISYLTRDVWDIFEGGFD